ncbi:hypothetical protein KBC03_01905 [Patescibacteria group bacterium]|nr:hypothetical protein [Patescibacteria group bacterium]
MRDPKWYDSDKLPEDEMRPSDKIRVPKIIEGGNILAVVYHEDDGKLIEYIPVQSFDEVDHEYFNKH